MTLQIYSPASHFINITSCTCCDLACSLPAAGCMVGHAAQHFVEWQDRYLYWEWPPRSFFLVSKSLTTHEPGTSCILQSCKTEYGVQACFARIFSSSAPTMSDSCNSRKSFSPALRVGSYRGIIPYFVWTPNNLLRIGFTSKIIWDRWDWLQSNLHHDFCSSCTTAVLSVELAFSEFNIKA